MSVADDTIFRVIPMPQSLIKAFRNTRDQREETNAEFVQKTIDVQLPKLVNALTELGFGKAEGRQKPLRLPFSSKLKSLEKLRQASATTHVPATMLMTLCIKAATSTSGKGSRKPRKVNLVSDAETTELKIDQKLTSRRGRKPLPSKPDVTSS